MHSRAFSIDAYHGMGLCPFADLLNHSRAENVHFTGLVRDSEICEGCGSIDNENDENTLSSGSGSDDFMSKNFCFVCNSSPKIGDKDNAKNAVIFEVVREVSGAGE